MKPTQPQQQPAPAQPVQQSAQAIPQQGQQGGIPAQTNNNNQGNQGNNNQSEVIGSRHVTADGKPDRRYEENRALTEEEAKKIQGENLVGGAVNK